MIVRSEPEEMPLALNMRQLNKSFGTLRVLHNVDLDIPSGQRVSIIGRSGSGKTTLLRVIMTLESLDSGTIHVFGRLLGRPRHIGGRVPHESRAAREARADIGMVFQQFNLFPHLTALENIFEAPVHVRKVPRAEAREEARALLAKVGLANKADSYPHQISGGQKQRVAIARTLAMKPKIILFDEVTSALDPELVSEVLAVILNLARESNITMLIVTHEMKFAREIADRTIFMEQGSIVEDAPPAVIFGRPENGRTREFLKSVL
jgi:polar amino acid transport system ATP-binding protein